jgi:hypothetical protein
VNAKRTPGPAPSPGHLPGHHDPSPPVKALGRTLATDRVTAEVSSAFRAAGIRSILLKGPALARWLYDDGALRTYLDCDLLVSPEAFSGAERILMELGFQREGLDTIPHDWPKHARTWYRGGGGNVDLHRTLVGVGVSDVELWRILSSETETMRVGGAAVEVLDLPGRALVVALHAAKDGTRKDKVRHDLGHALDRVETGVWREAGRLGARLGALPAFAAGLRLLPPGERLARELDLPTEVPMEAALRNRGGAPPFAVGIEWLARAPGLRGKLALVGRKLVPPPAFMRSWTPLARGGPLGLAAAYVWRPFWVAWRVIPALVAWWRARRETRRSRAPRQTGS